MSAIDRVAAFVFAMQSVDRGYRQQLSVVVADDITRALTLDDLESLLADARRYQWLRDDFKFLPIQLYESTVWQPVYTPLRLVGPTVDEAIDSAMEKSK